MEKYGKYKKTNVEFLDEIPENWIEKRMRFVGYLYGGLSGKSADDFNKAGDENNKYFIPFTNIANNLVIDPNNLQTVIIKKDEKQNNVQNGDLFFLMSSENYDDVGKSAVLSNELPETYLNSFCKGFRITQGNIDSKFLNYQLHSKQHRHNLLIGANGFTRINLKIDKVKDLFIALPPTPEEQTAIANFLDRKTAEIDELIADKKRLLELYEEEKTAIINQAVTKGINPNVPMKDSGIEWLGEIPEHWEILPIKYTANVQTGRTPKIANSDIDFFENGDTNWYTPGDFDGNEILKESKRKIISEAFEKNQVELFPKQSIYLVSIGATLGKVSLSESEASANQQINIISFNKEIVIPHWGYYFIVGNKEMVLNEADYTTLPILNQTKLKNIWIAFPNIDEQKNIITHVNNELDRLRLKVGNTKKLIDLLTEYRTALISEVVTGKIKVI